MTINANKFALSSAITFALLWVLCSVIVITLPHQSMSMMGFMVHADMGNLQWDTRFPGLLAGLVAWSLSAAITGWLIATIYNRIL
ncbi:MAG: DUF5676 family membrane protein [Porticoccaceae bacterium]